MKITGGSLKVRSLVSYFPKDSQEAVEEKVNMIRIYSGAKFEAVDEALSGSVCAVLGLSLTYPGQGIGAESGSFEPLLEPVMTYRISLPEGVSAAEFLPKLRLIEEEDPELQISCNSHLGKIYAHLMGEVQAEILKSIVEERFGVEIAFDAGKII